MIIYYKDIILVFILLIIGCEKTNINSVESPSFPKVEFQVTGGYAGIQQQTIISENGEVVFLYYYKTHEYIISKILSKSQLDSLYIILDEIFDLDDEYRPEQSIMDNYTYKINYQSLSGNKKSIIAESGIEIPEELKIIIRKLSEINVFIQMNPDYGTLTSIWDIEDVIKKWKFSNIKLEKKVYYYNEMNESDSILSYFEEIKNNVGFNVLFLSQDSLYSIYDGGTDYGYFNVYEVFQAKLWNNYFQDDISITRDTGIVKTTNEWQQMDILFNNTYAYVIDKIDDNGRAVQLQLIPGKPYHNYRQQKNIFKPKALRQSQDKLIIHSAFLRFLS
ncbi:MAG: hypothetical protein WAM24_11625 [Ignavibacteriaceae bacterium]